MKPRLLPLFLLTMALLTLARALGTASAAVITYGYDRLYRLTSVSDPAVGSGAYTYDPAGNRTSRTRDGSTYTYDRADRISSVVGAAIPGSSTRPTGAWATD